jgi:hypothetical protein
MQIVEMCFFKMAAGFRMTDHKCKDIWLLGITNLTDQYKQKDVRLLMSNKKLEPMKSLT